MTSFADLIAPIEPARFLAEYWGKRPLHIQRPPQKTLDVLPWPRFNEVLGLAPHWSETRLKLVMQSRPALPERYCDQIDAPGGTQWRANPAKVQALLGLGASLVANNIQHVCPEVHGVARTLEDQFAALVGANVYCSFKDVQAFGTHFDVHDVFALQTEGEKVWHVYEGRADAPISGLPPGEESERLLKATRGRLLFEAPMKPGDVLYLPRGQYHDALASSQASLHVSFWVLPATGLAIFKMLEKAAEQESLFRSYLPDARDPAGLRAHLARLAERLRAMATAPALETDVLNAQRAAASFAANYQLPKTERPKYFVIVRRIPVLRSDAGYFADTGSAKIALGATHDAVEWLFGQRNFSLEDALARHPFVDRSELTAILERLRDTGAIAETNIS